MEQERLTRDANRARQKEHARSGWSSSNIDASNVPSQRLLTRNTFLAPGFTSIHRNVMGRDSVTHLASHVTCRALARICSTMPAATAQEIQVRLATFVHFGVSRMCVAVSRGYTILNARMSMSRSRV